MSVLRIDDANGMVSLEQADGTQHYPLDSPEASALVTRAWLRCGGANPYGFTWLGRPVARIPDDMLRLQEFIHALQPDVIIETGVRQGGSLVFYASLCIATGRGRVIGIDSHVGPRTLAALRDHPLKPYIELVIGAPTDAPTVEAVALRVLRGETVLVLLDSGLGGEQALAELEAYCRFVSPGSYIVASGGLKPLPGTAARREGGRCGGDGQEAARRFACGHPEFRVEQPALAGGGQWPAAFLQRL